MESRHFQAGASASAPIAPVTPSTGYATNGNPGTGIPATQPGEFWFHKIGEELRGVITGAGLTPSDADILQVAKSIQSGGLNIGVAGGTADIITSAFTPIIVSLNNGMSLNVRAALTNATTTPTFTPNNGTIAAKTIVKGNDLPLLPGDIAGTGHWIELQYDATLDKWVLSNPAYGLEPPLIKQIQPFTAATASAVLTGSFAAASLDYRDGNAANGVSITIGNGNLALPIPSTSNLGTLSSGTIQRLIWMVAYNAGAPVLCVANQQGGINLDETGFVSPITISGSSSAADVVYSASAVASNSPYRVVGFTDVIFTTGTGWSSPNLVQGAGGLALASMGSIGNGQIWIDALALFGRSSFVTYYNTTGKSIMIAVSFSMVAVDTALIKINGSTIVNFNVNAAAGTVSVQCPGTIIVPPGGSYFVIGNVISWYELR